jgi:HD-GYP domain-containing protein (c-di-GMP phosphodiesterase class II)
MNYTPIRISTLRPGPSIPFRLFIHFKEHYLEYTHPGDSIEAEKFQKLKKQKIAKFYIEDKDEGKYQSFIDQLLADSLKDPSLPVEAKVDMVEGVATTALEKTQTDPTSEASVTMTKSAAKGISELILKNPGALATFFNRNVDAAPIIHHSLNVCALSVKFAKKLKHNDQEIDDLSTAALMHDIGVALLPTGSVQFLKSREALNAQEKLNYWAHCHNMVKPLRGRPYSNERVLNLIENHEENRSGTGPNKKIKLDPLEEILSLVNTYDKRRVSEGKNPAETMREMMIDEVGNYELKMIQSFQEMLKEEKIISSS